jgi:hypothetical protein
MADSTLLAIRNKVRRLTRSPSVAQITDAEINEYINTFVLYDFPEQLRLFSLRKTFTFYTDPGTDVYETGSTAPAPLTNFDNLYITTHEPVYVAGYKVLFTQSRDQFYGMYPFTNSIVSTGLTGDGVTVAFSGTLSSVPILKNNVLFTSKDINGLGLRLSDDGAAGPTGTLSGDGTGTINYETGAYTLNFATAPAASEVIYSETVPYVAARPDSILYFDNTFIVRPVPDKVYPIVIEVYKRPTELLADGDEPELQQFWQYLAYGAAVKVFQDRTDHESAQAIMPEFKRQEALVLRRTIVQQTKERVATIYTEGLGTVYGPGWWSGAGR